MHLGKPLSHDGLMLYQALEARPTPKVDLLRRHPEVDVDGALTELADRRLIRTNGQGLVARVPAHVAAAQVLPAITTLLGRSFDTLSQLYDDYSLAASSDALNAGGACSEDTYVLEGDADVERHTMELCRSARRSIEFMDKESFPITASYADKSLLLHGLRERGVMLRALSRPTKRLGPVVDLLASSGCEVRTSPTVPCGFILVDRLVAVVPGVAGSTGGAVVKDRSTVALLSDMFGSLWQESIPRHPARREGTSDMPVEPTTSTVLQQLALGHTDEVAARRLGVSTRTFRRRVSRIAEEFGVDTRFQLGVAAAQYLTAHSAGAPPGADDACRADVDDGAMFVG